MDRYDPADYGERIAAVYDDLFGGMIDTDQAVETLAALAGEGPVLELGIGTGRLALALAARGVEVHGIDASEAMVARLRAKPGGRDIPVTMGDFRDVPAQGMYRLVVLAFNTIFALLSQEDQVRCFRAVAGHLTADGAFVLEAFVPDMTRWQNNQTTQTTRLEDGRLLLETSLHDPANQRIDSSLNLMGQDGMRMYPVHIRYAWPAELDLMARLGGLSLRERWGGWDRRTFDSSSTKHVSVYRPSST
jgi:SAM-dependent methyltransferase